MVVVIRIVQGRGGGEKYMIKSYKLIFMANKLYVSAIIMIIINNNNDWKVVGGSWEVSWWINSENLELSKMFKNLGVWGRIAIFGHLSPKHINRHRISSSFVLRWNWVVWEIKFYILLIFFIYFPLRWPKISQPKISRGQKLINLRYVTEKTN